MSSIVRKPRYPKEMEKKMEEMGEKVETTLVKAAGPLGGVVKATFAVGRFVKSLKEFAVEAK